MKSLAQTRAERDERKLDSAIDAMIDSRLAKANLAFHPQAKVKLRGVLKKYAGAADPYAACRKDNIGKFGPGRTEAICSTLKNTIKSGGKKAPPWMKGKVDASIHIDGDVLLVLDAISEIDLQEIMLEARALDEHGTVESVGLLSVSGKSELQTWGDRVV